MTSHDPAKKINSNSSKVDLAAAEFREGAVIRSVCETNPLAAEIQQEHLLAIRHGMLAVRAVVAEFPGVLSSLRRLSPPKGDFSVQQDLEIACNETTALWAHRGEPEWEARYSQKMKLNAQLVLEAFDELFELSDRPYAEIMTIEGQVREICRGVLWIDRREPPEKRAEQVVGYEQLALRPFEALVESARRIEEIDKTTAPRKQLMVESNLRLVARAVANFKGRFDPQALEAPGSLDLFQEGVLGLMAAIERFQPEKGFRFSTYAMHWIRQAIGRGTQGQDTIEIPVHVKNMMARERRAREALTQELGMEPHIDAVHARMSLSDGAREALRLARRAKLESTREQTELPEKDPFESVPDRSESATEQVIVEEERARVMRALDRLFDVKTRAILEQRFANVQRKSGGSKSQTLAAIAESLSLTRQRISQVELASIALLTDYFIIDSFRPGVRTDTLVRVGFPQVEQVVRDIWSDKYPGGSAKSEQAHAVMLGAAVLMIVEIGEGGLRQLADTCGLAPGGTFVLRDRIFGRHNSFESTAEHLAKSGPTPVAKYGAEDTRRMFLAGIRQLAPALREEFRRRQARL